MKCSLFKATYLLQGFRHKGGSSVRWRRIGKVGRPDASRAGRQVQEPAYILNCTAFDRRRDLIENHARNLPASFGATALVRFPPQKKRRVP